MTWAHRPHGVRTRAKIAFSGEFVAFILGSKNTGETGLATDGLPSTSGSGGGPSTATIA